MKREGNNTTDVELLHHALCSVKTSERKTGVNKLVAWLEVPEFLLQLDEETQDLSQYAKLTPHQASWPAIAHSLCKCVALEFASTNSNGKKRSTQDDLIFARSLRTFVQAAENSAKRSKLLHPLQRKSKKLFTTAVVEIERQTLSSVAGKELNELLRSHLLQEADYCGNVDSVTKQKLVVVYTRWLSQENYAKHKDEFYRNIDTLRLVLVNLPGDVCKTVRLNLCEFFASTFKFVDNYSKVGHSIFRALNAFLFKHSFDVCSKIETLSALPYRLIRGTWEKSRHRGYRIAICEFIELELLYNAQRTDFSLLSELLCFISRDLENAQTDVFLSELCGTRQYTRTAALVARSVLTLDFRDPKAPAANQGPVKRQKLVSWHEKLWGEAMASPAKWGAVLCMLLHSHSGRIPNEILMDWLVALDSRLAESESSFLLPGKSDAGLLWLTRLANHLSMCFWDCGRREEPGSSLKKHKKVAPGEIWNSVYGRITKWLNGSSVQTTMKSETLMVLSNISLLGNVPCHAVDEVFLGKSSEERGSAPWLMFLGSCLCLPNKKVHVSVEESLKSLAEGVWSSSKVEQSAYRAGGAWGLTLARLIFMTFLTSPDSKSILDLRKLSRALSISWLTSKEADELSLTSAFAIEYDLARGILCEHRGSTEEEDSCLRWGHRLRLSGLALEVFDLISRKLSQCDAEDLIVWCGVLAKVGKYTKCMQNRSFSNSSAAEEQERSKVEESIIRSAKRMCKLLPSAVEKVLASSNGLKMKAFIEELNLVLGDLNFLDPPRKYLEHLYNKLVLVISDAARKMLGWYDPYYKIPEQGPKSSKEKFDIDFDFDDSGSKRVSSLLLGAQECIRLLTVTLERIGSVCPESAYKSLCEMRENFDFDLRTEIMILSSMWSVGLRFPNVPIEPLKSLCRIQEVRKNISTQCLVLESFQTLFRNADRDQASLMYDSAIDFVKGVERWMLENESTASLRISLGMMLESLIRTDAVKCHEEGLDEILLILLRDECYLVRLEAAKQIGVLFDSWQDHAQVFGTICGYLSLPSGCQDLIETSQCNLEDVEEILASVFALAFFVSKSKKVERLGTVVICVVLISKFSNNLILKCSVDALEKLAKRLGYTLSGHLKLFQNAIVANLKPDLLLSQDFTNFASTFLRDEGSTNLFASLSIGCVEEKYQGRLIKSLGLSADCKEPEKVMRSSVLRLMAQYARGEGETGARDYTFTYLEENPLPENWSEVENMAVILSTVLECVADDPSVKPHVTAGEGSDMIFALLSRSGTECASFHDGVFSLALRRLKLHIDATNFHHRQNCIHSLHILAELQKELGVCWKNGINYAIGICTENLETPGIDQQVPLSLLARLLEIRIEMCTKKHAMEDMLFEFYVTLARFSVCSKRIKAARESSADFSIMSRVVERILKSLNAAACSGVNLAACILHRSRDVLQDTCFEKSDFFASAISINYEPHQQLHQRIEYVWKNSVESNLLPPDVVSRCAECVNVLDIGIGTDIKNAEYFDQLRGAKLRFYCLDLIKNHENLSSKATLALTEVLEFLGPFSASTSVMCTPSEDINKLAGKISVSRGKSLSVTDREYHRVRISLATMNLLFSWISHTDPVLEYESFLSLIRLENNSYARLAWKHMSIDARRFISYTWAAGRRNEPRKQVLKDSETISMEDSWSRRATVDERVHRIAGGLLPFCKNEVLRSCKSLIASAPKVGRSILPLLIEDISLHNASDSVICKQLASAIQEHVFHDKNACDALAGIFLDIFERLRALYSVHQKHSQQDKLKWSSCYWFRVDYLDVATLALSRNQYFTALLYIEQWHEQEYGTFHDLERCKRKDMDHAAKRKSLKKIETMLIDIFKGVGELDSVYAFATNMDLETQLRIFEHEGKWDKALQTYDILLSTNSEPLEDYKSGMTSCMKSLGCSYLANTFGGKLRGTKVPLTEEQYERAWHQCDWSLPVMDLSVAESPELNQSIYNCVYALKAKDTDFFQTSKSLLYKSIISSLRVNGSESTMAANQSVIALQMVNLLSKSFDAIASSGEVSSLGDAGLHHFKGGTFLKGNKFGGYQQSSFVDNYALLKPLFKLYTSVLTALECKLGLQKACLHEAQVSRMANDLTQSTSNMGVVKQMCRVCKLDSEFEVEVKLEELRNLWDQDLERIALSECKKLYDALEFKNGRDKREWMVRHIQFSTTCSLLGKWLASSSSESPSEICKILSAACTNAQMGIRAMDGVNDDLQEKQQDLSVMLCNAYFNLAQFCDRQYRAILKEQTSPQWQARQRLLAYTDKQLELLATKKKGSGRSSADKEFLHYKAMATRFHEEDQKVAMTMDTNKHSFLSQSVSYYESTLVTANLHDNEVVFRICQLWFENSDEIQYAMEKLIDKVPTHKFLCLMYQIGSRLGPSKRGTVSFESLVSKLLTKMCFDHPHHTLPHMFAFCNAGRGKDGTERDSKSNAGYAVDTTKVLAAKAILQRVRKKNSQLIDQYVRMVDSYIQLAVLPVSKNEDEAVVPNMPRSVKELRDLEHVPILTSKVDVDETCQYQAGHFACFSCFQPELKLVGGINAPKLVTAIDSNGKKHMQLAKSGNDDLRQDAVMQQLFNLVNHLLSACAKTRKRQLGLQTYNVVPLTPAAGLVEWVQDSIPLMKYLVGESGKSSGAHRRLRPQDWTYNQCLRYLYKEQNSRPAAKRETFGRICKNFQPVMHHFFLEHFPNTSEWFQRRLAYTRSIAASSMVGYVVGLGDRHPSNILIHATTAEVIHIDLGIAFEQGRVLKIPETVPFRLTRDVVDGMGVSGVEGTMRRCSEEVMDVLRANKDLILTIVGVFIHDPLYKWALSPVKNLLAQMDESDDFGNLQNLSSGLEFTSKDSNISNADAERAIMKVKEKLEGLEYGERKSVQGQVQHLLREAQDPENLSLLYCGWGPWL